MNVHDFDDARLEQLLADTLAVVEAVPDDAVSAAYAAADMRSISEELATLVFDSGSERELAGMRSAGVDARLLSFVHDDVTVDLQLPGDGHALVGQITPAGDHPVVVETEDGQAIEIDADEYGRFRATVPDGRLRVRLVGLLVTPWVGR